MDVLGVDHIDLTVNDVARSTPFYEEVLGRLGFRRVKEPGHPIWANAHLGIAIRPPSDERRGAVFDRYRVGMHHLALRVARRSDVDEFHAWLVEHGFEVLDAPAEYPEYGPSYYAVFFADPDGMKLEVVHFPWGHWRRAMTEGRDERPRWDPKE